ncbi:MAG: hypothetical protein ACOH5I_22985 [Oligoflexus sp.]
MRTRLTILGFVLLSFLSSCAENKASNFQNGSGSSDLANQPNEIPPTPLPDNEVDFGDSSGLDSCVEGDKIVVPWSGPVKECFDQGKTYNFDTKTCAEIRKAEFSCDWETLQAKLLEKNLLSNTLKEDAASGAKLVSCGQSADGNRIAVQWVKITNIETQTCNTLREGAGVTTGCYTHYVNQQPPPPPATVEERRQRVFDCLNTL